MQILVALLVAILSSQAAPAATTGRIAGRVTAEGTNAPVPGARVMLIPFARPVGPTGMPSQATTDEEGRFAFEGLAPGEYRLDVQRTGFAPLFNPGTRPGTIQLAAGQSVDDVRVQLQRGGVITGKVLDPSGEPFADARIMVMRRVAGAPGGTASRFIPAPMQGQQQTNDLGEFRVSGLAPGEYYVAAMRGLSGPGGATPAPQSNGSVRTVFTTTYYPGTTDSTGAQSVIVESGKEVNSLIFTMQSAPAFRVSGFVVDENGAPVSHAMVMLMGDPRNGMFMGPAGNTQTQDDGRFVIGDVAAGSYRVTATVPVTFSNGTISGGVVGGGTFTTFSSGVQGGPNQPPEITVADADVNGVRVVVRRPTQ
jgi:protocatechuate 3,4-dioxygenase beta subunit